MADCGHGYIFRGGVADEFDHAAVTAHVVRRTAAGDDDEGVIRSMHGGRCFIGLLGVAVLADISLTGLWADDFDGVTCFLSSQAPVLKLEVFVDFFDEDRDFGHGVSG
jgi:hypothetical protein